MFNYLLCGQALTRNTNLFCDPSSPYQKGQVQRTNAFLHKFIPKKTDFNQMTPEQIIYANDKINNLPKKCLNSFAPNEAWNINLNSNRCTSSFNVPNT